MKYSRLNIMSKIVKCVVLLVIFTGCLPGLPKAHAEIITVTGSGSYTLGDGSSESIDIAKKRAREDALRNAGKQAGVYVESLTVVQSGKLTSDEVCALTVELLNVQGEPHYQAEVLENSIICYHCDITAQVDTDTITPQVLAESRKNRQLKIDEAKKCFDRGTAYLGAKEYQLAISEFDKGISLYSQDASAYNNRGNAYAELQNYQKAIEDFIQADALIPQNEVIYRNLGNAYLKSNEYAKSIPCYDKVIELNPRYIEAYLWRGAAYYYLRDYRKSLADFNKVLEINPNNELARECRRELMKELGL